MSEVTQDTLSAVGSPTTTSPTTTSSVTTTTSPATTSPDSAKNAILDASNELRAVVGNTTKILQGLDALGIDSVTQKLDEIKKEAIKIVQSAGFSDQLEAGKREIQQLLEQALKELEAQGGITEQEKEAIKQELNTTIEQFTTATSGTLLEYDKRIKVIDDKIKNLNFSSNSGVSSANNGKKKELLKSKFSRPNALPMVWTEIEEIKEVQGDGGDAQEVVTDTYYKRIYYVGGSGKLFSSSEKVFEYPVKIKKFFIGWNTIFAVCKDEPSAMYVTGEWHSNSNAYNTTGTSINGGVKKINFEDNIVDVKATQYQTYVLLANGVVYCVGYNPYGQFGLSNANNVTGVFIPSGFNSGFSGIEVSGDSYGYFYAWKTTQLYMAGYGSGNYGNGYSSSLNYAYNVYSFSANIVSVYAVNTTSYQRTYVILENGDVWASGYNSYYQLGNNSTSQSSGFSKITNLSQKNIKEIIGDGDSHYYLQRALSSDGELYTWGNGTYGYGNAKTASQQNAPEIIASDVKSMSVYDGDKYFYLNNTGELFVWGNNVNIGSIRSSREAQKIASDVIDFNYNGDELLVLKKDFNVYTIGGRLGTSLDLQLL